MAFRWWVDEGATLNDGLVASRVSLDQDLLSFVIIQGVRTTATAPFWIRAYVSPPHGAMGWFVVRYNVIF